MRYSIIILLFLVVASCKSYNDNMKKIIFLHHSTGYNVWLGNTNKYVSKLIGKSDVKTHIIKHNRRNKTNYTIEERFFPKSAPYGWNNYPYDYYNIWVRNSGTEPYLEEPTLEILSSEYDVVIFKHCFPVSKISQDSGQPDINSPVKSLENYKLQYQALKNKMHQFPDNKFIIWTPAVNTSSLMSEDEALRTKEFYEWMNNVWDEKGDNIFLWDFYAHETEGGLYLAEKNAKASDNSHPNQAFAARIAPLFSKYIIDVIENRIE